MTITENFAMLPGRIGLRVLFRPIPKRAISPSAEIGDDQLAGFRDANRDRRSRRRAGVWRRTYSIRTLGNAAIRAAATTPP